MSKCAFRYNRAEERGGAIKLFDRTQVDLDCCEFNGNRAKGKYRKKNDVHKTKQNELKIKYERFFIGRIFKRVHVSY